MYLFKYIEDEKRIALQDFIKSHGCGRLTPKTTSVKLNRDTLLHDIMNHKYAEELLFQILANEKGEIDSYRYCEIVKYYELTHKSDAKQIQKFYQNMLKLKFQLKKELDEKAEQARKERLFEKYSTKQINYYIEKYINSGKNVKDFIQNTKITEYMFREMVKIAKDKNLAIYKKYEKYKKEKASETGKSLLAFANEVIETLSKPEVTELDCLMKYNFNIYNLEHLIKSFKIKTNYNVRRKLNRIKLIQSSSHIQRIRESTYIFHNHELTEIEKEQALNLLKKYHISYHEIAFKQALKKLEII